MQGQFLFLFYLKINKIRCDKQHFLVGFIKVFMALPQGLKVVVRGPQSLSYRGARSIKNFLGVL